METVRERIRSFVRSPPGGRSTTTGPCGSGRAETEKGRGARERGGFQGNDVADPAPLSHTFTRTQYPVDS